MKVTVKKKEEKIVKLLDWKKLPLGTLIEGTYDIQAMVFSSDGKKELLIISPGKYCHLQKAIGFLERFVVFRIIGQVAEIIVEEN